MIGVQYVCIAAIASQALAAAKLPGKRQTSNETLLTDINVISQYWGTPTYRDFSHWHVHRY